MPVNVKAIGDLARVAKKADDKAYADDDAETIDLDAAVKADTDGKEWDVKLNAAMDSTEVYELLINLTHDTDDISDLANVVKLADQSTTAGFQHDPVEFAGTTTAPSAITGVYATMSDERTILVHFPVAMDATDVVSDIYAIHDTSAADNEVDVPLYRIYNATDKILTIYLGAPLAAADEYYLEVEGTDTLKDAAGTRAVNDGKTSAGNLVVQFAESTDADAAPAVKSVSVADDRYSMTITFTEDVAFAEADNTDFADNSNFVTGLTEAELLDAISVTAQFESETEADAITSTEFALTQVADDNETQIVLTFNEKLAVASNGTVTTEDEDADMILNRNAVAAKVTSSATSVDYGVSASLYTDGTAPDVVTAPGSATDNGAESFAEAATFTIVFNELLNSTSRDAVEAAIVAAGNDGETAADFDFDWVTNSKLTVTVVDDADNAAYAPTADVTAAISDGTNNTAAAIIIND
jgi:hypothetical protein